MTKKTTAQPKKRGRPARPGGKDPVLPARVPRETIKAIDAWASKKGLRRSEAVRMLIEAGLAATLSSPAQPS